MEIHGPNNIDRASRIDAARQAGRAYRTKSEIEAAKSDSVELSEKARKMAEVNRYQAELANVPDVRRQRIETIKTEIESGKYITEEKIDQAVDNMLPDIFGR